MTDTDISFDLTEALSSADFARDPYPVYAELRAVPGWVAPSGYRVFSAYADVLQILRQPDIFGQERVPYPNFHTTDQPEHTRLRRLVAKAFTAQSIGLLNDRIAAIVGRLLDDLEGRSEFDLISDFAQRLSAAVIAEVLQVPEEDAIKWYGWIHDLARFRGVTRFFPLESGNDPGALDAAKKANEEAAAYMGKLIETHRSLRDGGLFSAREKDDSLSEEEILYTLILLLGAGLHTTSGQLGNTLRAILSRPEVVADLRDDPSRVPNALEEALRFDGALQAEYRVVRSDVALQGFNLEAGDHLIVMNGAANHDPDFFENPSEFDIHRENARRHLTFGFGIHHCLGAELARTEIVTAVRELLRCFPSVALVGPGEQTASDRWRGLSTLPARVSR